MYFQITTRTLILKHYFITVSNYLPKNRKKLSPKNKVFLGKGQARQCFPQGISFYVGKSSKQLLL